MATLQIRYGIGPIGWANDDLREWSAVASGDQILREIAQAGYHATEMSYLFPQEPLALKAALDPHGLVLSAAYHWTNLGDAARFDEEMEKARRHIDFCANAGARHAILAEGSGSLHWDPDGPRDAVRPLDDAAWERLLRGLNGLGTYGRSRRMTVCLHPHAGTAIEGAAEVERFLNGTDAQVVGWCIDTAHTAYGGMDPEAMIRRWGHRIEYVHLKDVRRKVLQAVRADGVSFFDAVRADVFAAPGGGSLDFVSIAMALREIAYEGWLIVEADQDPAAHPPLEVARSARQFLRSIFGR